MSPALAARRASVAVALAGALLSFAGPSAAEPSEAQRTQARELAAEATQAFNAGDFPRAVGLVRQAYALDPAPVLLYNLARALEASGDDAGARDAYRRYLEVAPNASDRGAVQGRIEILEQKLSEREKLEGQRKPGRPIAPAKPEPGATPPTPRARPSFAPWIAIGVGATSLGTGVVLGLAARNERADGAAPETNGRDAQDAEESARSLARWSNVTVVAGAALSVVGVTWLLIDTGSKREQARTSLRAHVGPFGIGVSGQL